MNMQMSCAAHGIKATFRVTCSGSPLAQGCGPVPSEPPWGSRTLASQEQAALRPCQAESRMSPTGRGEAGGFVL